MSERFDRLVQLMARLRAPGGCPWDRKQTHESLKPYLVEEAYEVLETIDRKDAASLREELGDLLLQVIFHAQIGSEAGAFTIDQILETLAEKLIRRHPHVFGGTPDPGASTAEEVLHRWEEIKRAERKQTETSKPGAAQGGDSSLEGVPKTLPALLRAYQIQARASRVGFDWPHTADGIEQVTGKIEEEVGELIEAYRTEPSSDGHNRVEAEFGDLLFALVNLARLLKVHPEEALRKATNRFAERFRYIEAQAARTGRPLEKMTLAEMDALWEEAKQQETPSSTGSEKAP
jgi:tetrapyrrole methylase family protein/MazG family protein